MKIELEIVEFLKEIKRQYSLLFDIFFMACFRFML